MRDARKALKEIAAALRLQAIDCHADGMSLLERSVRISQLAKWTTDEEAEQLLADFEAEGLIQSSITCTSDGGEA